MDGISFIEIWKMIFNIIFISIPEEVFLVVFSFLVQKRYDLLKPNKKNVVRLFVPVLSLAVLSNVMRIHFEAIADFMPLIAIFILSASTVLAYNMIKFKQIVKVFASYLLSYLVGSIIQLSYMPLLLSATGLDPSELNNYGFLLIVITLPERVIECCIIAYYVMRRKSMVKINIFKEIFKNRTLTIVTMFVFIINVLFITVTGKLVFFNRILSNLGLVVQFIVITGVLIFPIINITMLWGVIHNITTRETFNRMLSKERLETLISILEVYANSGNYEKVDTVISDINKHLDRLYQYK